MPVKRIHRSHCIVICLLVTVLLCACTVTTYAGDGPDIPLTEIVNSERPRDIMLIDAVRDFIPNVMRAQNTPGLNIALARHGEIIWEAGFGYANLESRQPMTPETTFRSGSMGKTYTGTAIMQLVERGVIDVHERADKHLPFTIENPLGDRPVTVHDLLTHQSGLAYGDAAQSTPVTPWIRVSQMVRPAHFMAAAPRC